MKTILDLWGELPYNVKSRTTVARLRSIVKDCQRVERLIRRLSANAEKSALDIKIDPVNLEVHIMYDRQDSGTWTTFINTGELSLENKEERRTNRGK